MTGIVRQMIDVTPHQSLMPKLGSAGYSAPQAIAELVDNSIDAALDDCKLEVSIKISKDEVIVADNGRGMDRRTIANALRLAHSEKQAKLGQFGLGLKTSCFSLGRRFEIRSSALGVPHEYRAEIDEDRWLREEEHWKVALEETPASEGDHFTIVKVSKLKNAYPGLKELVLEDLGRRYAPYLRNGDVSIKVNAKPCRGAEFDLVPETRKEFEISTPSGQRIHGWYALLKKGSSRGLYGFSTYRRGRMITTYDKIGIREHPTISRVVGEVHLDHVPVTHNKREFIRDSAEYREAERALRKEFDAIVRLARQKASEESVTRTVKAELEKVKETITEVLRASEFKPFTEFLVGPSEPKRDPSGPIEAIPVEKRERKALPEAPEPTPEPEPAPPVAEPRGRTPKSVHDAPRHSVRIHGKTVSFRHAFAALGEKESWKRWHFDQQTGLDIYTNTDFPAFYVARDKRIYSVIQIAEAIAEFWVKSSGETRDRVDEVKEMILRRVAEALEEWPSGAEPDSAHASQETRSSES